jgi:hypothetical protein
MPIEIEALRCFLWVTLLGDGFETAPISASGLSTDRVFHTPWQQQQQQQQLEAAAVPSSISRAFHSTTTSFRSANILAFACIWKLQRLLPGLSQSSGLLGKFLFPWNTQPVFKLGYLIAKF